MIKFYIIRHKIIILYFIIFTYLLFLHIYKKIEIQIICIDCFIVQSYNKLR